MMMRLFLIFGLFLSTLALSCAGHKSGHIQTTADLAAADSAATETLSPIVAEKPSESEKAPAATKDEPAVARTSGRAGEAPKISATEARPLVHFLESAGNDAEPTRGKNDKAAGERSEETAAAQPGASGQYLLIKFHQNDTDIEMAIDPHTTNLNLDLVRGPNGTMEIARGDSVLFKKEAAGGKADVGEELTASDSKKLDDETLTDDIIGDINLAQKMFYEHKYDEALRVLRQSLKKKRTATAYALGGSIYYVSGEIDAAVSAWENALKINPNLPRVRELVLRYKK